jgi:DNA-binding CsgD family transcriptional regulator
VISIGNERLEFRHPLLRAAAYDLASADERRSAHRALAGAMTGRADSASRAWHLAAAAIGPDELAAQALEAAALDAQARGDLNSAAAAFDKASSLSAAREMRVRRSMSAATALSMVGRVPEAIHLLDRAAGETADPVQLAAIRSLRGVAGTWSGRPREAHDNLVAEALEVMNVDPASAASMLTIATINRYTTGDIKEALKTARLSRTALRKSGGRNLVRGELFYLSALLLSGKGTSVKRGLMKIAGSMNEIDIADSALDVGMLGLDLIWLEEFELARQKLEHLLSRAREAGAIGVLVYPMTVVSELEFRTGNWPSSFVAATEAVTLGTEFKQVNALTYALVTLARIEAAMGQDAESRLHSEAASSLAAELDTGSIITYASSVEGFRALGNNRPEEAVAHLAMLPDYVVGNGMGNPNAVQWRPDLIEAAVLCGRQDLARQQLEIFEAERDRTGSQWAAITSARCRGLLADDDGFEGHFLRALDGHPAFAAPFEDARTLLAFGRRLRRQGRRMEARERLLAALAQFDALGARPWANSTQAELAASGMRAAPRKRPDPMRLTAQEMQVAILVAEGATNRDAAARMFLSPRTIESHLRRVYSKLGLRSRTELLRWVNAQGQLPRPA